MCSYFNPDCGWCEEYEQRFEFCARMEFGEKCVRYDDDARSCEGCEHLIEDGATAYRCSRDGGCYMSEDNYWK